MAKIRALAFLRPELSGRAVSILPATPPILGPGCHGVFSPPCPLQALRGGAVASKLPSHSHRTPAPQGQLQELNSGPASSPGEGAAWSHSELRVPGQVRPGWELQVSSALIWRKRGPA